MALWYNMSEPSEKKLRTFAVHLSLIYFVDLCSVAALTRMTETKLKRQKKLLMIKRAVEIYEVLLHFSKTEQTHPVFTVFYIE